MSAGQQLILSLLAKQLHLESARLAMATLEMNLAMDDRAPATADAAWRMRDTLRPVPPCPR